MDTKVALITGGGSGIGRAVALKLHAAGYAVVVAGRRIDRLKETAGMASGEAKIMPVPVDVTDPGSVERLFAQTAETFGHLDVLFNNAGASAPAIPLEDLSFEEWSEVVSVNLTGAFLCARQAIRIMKSQTPRGGRIINNGSISAHVPRPNSAPYTATKHAITGLTRSISLDGRRWDIACSQIDIGNAVSERTEKMATGILQPNGEMMIEPRMDVDLVAGAVLFMANLPLEANVQFITLMATKMPYIGRG